MIRNKNVVENDFLSHKYFIVYYCIMKDVFLQTLQSGFFCRIKSIRFHAPLKIINLLFFLNNFLQFSIFKEEQKILFWKFLVESFKIFFLPPSFIKKFLIKKFSLATEIYVLSRLAFWEFHIWIFHFCHFFFSLEKKVD